MDECRLLSRLARLRVAGELPVDDVAQDGDDLLGRLGRSEGSGVDLLQCVLVLARFSWVVWNSALPSAMAGLAVMMPHTTSDSSCAMEFAVHRRDPGEGAEIVVDQRLAGDRDDPAMVLTL